MIFLYKILVTFAFILALPILPFLYLFSSKRRVTLGHRLGISFPGSLTIKRNKRLWIHALSVGEVKSAFPLVQALKDNGKDLEIVFTASTKTGFAMAESLFLKPEAEMVDHLAYFPFDLGWSIRRISSSIDPDAIILVETDLWPNFLYEMNKKNIPVVLINARLSRRSLKGYLRFKPFVKMFLSQLKSIMVQSSLDESRFGQLGIEKTRIIRTGNIKFDQPKEKITIDHIAEIKKRFGIKKNRSVFIGGSTHEGEEKILCRVFKNIIGQYPDLVLIIAPRNPERGKDLLRFFNTENLNAVLMSELDGTNCPEVVIVDTMGELARLYSVCDIAFIGGSLVAQGGHNPLEPAAFAKPVLFGPDMSDFSEISNLLLGGKGSFQVETEFELETVIQSLLADTDLRSETGKKNLEIFLEHSGAVKRIIKHMEYLNFV